MKLKTITKVTFNKTKTKTLIAKSSSLKYKNSKRNSLTTMANQNKHDKHKLLRMFGIFILIVRKSNNFSLKDCSFVFIII